MIGRRQDPDRVVLDVVREVVPWETPTENIHPRARLADDLGLDSMARVVLAFRLGEELGVDWETYGGEVLAIEDVADVQAAVRELLAA